MTPIITIRLEEEEIQRHIPYAALVESTNLLGTGTAKRLRKEMGMDEEVFKKFRAKARTLYRRGTPKVMFLSPEDLSEWDRIGKYLAELFKRY